MSLSRCCFCPVQSQRCFSVTPFLPSMECGILISRAFYTKLLNITAKLNNNKKTYLSCFFQEPFYVYIIFFYLSLTRKGAKLKSVNKKVTIRLLHNVQDMIVKGFYRAIITIGFTPIYSLFLSNIDTITEWRRGYH